MRRGWRGSDPQLAEFFGIILPVQDFPFTASLDDRSLLRGDAAFHDLIDLFFLLHEVRKDFDDLHADVIRLLVDFHLIQSLDRGHDLVRYLNDFFVTHLHVLENDFALPHQFLLDSLKGVFVAGA